MNENVLYAILAVWLPIAGVMLALCMFPGQLERLWNSQNGKDE